MRLSGLEVTASQLKHAFDKRPSIVSDGSAALLSKKALVTDRPGKLSQPPAPDEIDNQYAETLVDVETRMQHVPKVGYLLCVIQQFLGRSNVLQPAPHP